MSRNVVDQVADVGDVGEAVGRLPDEVALALGDIAEAAREGLLALCVSTGLEVLSELMESERTVLCGPIHDKNPDRVAVRGGTTPSSVVLGSRRVPIRRPRVQSSAGEVELESFRVANYADLLGRVAMERMLAGLATRRYRAANEPVGEKVEAAAASSSMSKSSVSRRFVAGTRRALDELLSRDLSQLDPAVLRSTGSTSPANVVW